MESVDSSSHNPTQIDSWLKQQPQLKRQSSVFASHNSTFNNNINTNYKTLSISSSTSSSMTMHERNIMSTSSTHWNSYHQRSSIVPSPTLSMSSISSSSGPSLSLPKKASAIGLNGQFLPLPDMEPLMIHPKDDEDEEDDNQRSDNTSNESLTVMSGEDKQRRIGFLEKQFVQAQREAQIYKEQLEYHDQTAQRMLESLLAEKEKQRVEIRQLVDVIEKQEQLIHLLQQRASLSVSKTTTDTALSPLSLPFQEKSQYTNAEFEAMRLQMIDMRKELDTLISEKRGLETRMAAFLEDELDDIAMSHEDLGTFGYSSSDQQHQEILQHLEMRRRSSSLLDADQYSLMAFGTTPTTSNIQVSASNSSGLLPPLNQVDEEDDDDCDDAVSRYSSFASSPMTATTSFNSHSISSPTSFANRQSTFISSPSNTMTSPTTAANNNAARKAAWSRVMIPTERSMQLPPATPPPSHPLPPVPPINALQAAATIKEDYNNQEYTPPSPATTTTSRSTRSFSPSHRMSMHPLVISTALYNQSKHTSADAITQGQHPVRSISPSLPSAPPTTASPQSSSLLAALNKNHSVDANIERSIATGSGRTSTESVMAGDKGGFWKGMKKKWMK
ncbi:hypothetical protein BDA99DRAFT_167163 [Phascolomyces articulosus]|uniref:Uncharacterized protein n=1 Tax=Phascolomyces articulosus TaxID=60185 RepID=A0AAD5PCH2_9FUNG|nr:hypothetical protein BDA99DRAFT_167163 [Phascolomyces articulosus]